MSHEQQIGRYQLQDTIGEGGMSTVYLALDTDLQREVALKLLPAYMSHNHEFTQRFQRETRIVAQLEHVWIVPIYDIGEFEGRPYLVMRLLRGGTLRDKIAGQLLDAPKLITSLHHIAKALDEAHRNNIIHRDIKPTNILFDEQDEAFLADFGVAKIADATTDLTGTQTIGTPAYMSPEQFTGDPVDGRSDQYSLAVVAYEALTGTPPFIGNTMQIMYQHVHEKPPAPVLTNSNLPDEVGSILIKALAKDKNERYQTCTAFITALQTAYREIRVQHDVPTVLPLATSMEPHTPTQVTSKPKKIPKPLAKSRAYSVEKPRPSRPRERHKSVTDLIHEGAGGSETTSSVLRPMWVWGGGLVLVMILLIGGVWIFSADFLNTDISPFSEDDERLPIALLIGDFEDGLWQQGELLQRLPSSGEVVFKTGDGSLLQSVQGRFQIVLSDNTVIYLDQNTAVEIQQVNGVQGASQTSLRLQAGRIVIDPPNAGTQVLIENEYGAKALTEAGIMGLTQNKERGIFVIDCFSNRCFVIGDVDGVMRLMAGESTQVGDSGRPTASETADYDSYALVSEIVPSLSINSPNE